MISVLSYNRILREQKIIEEGCHHEVAKRTDERLAFTRALTEEQLQEFFRQDALTDIMYYEIKNEEDISGLMQLRKKEGHAMLMLMTRPDISPVCYLKPGIAPDILLFKPFDQAAFSKVNGELFDAFLDKLNAAEQMETYVLNTKEGKTLIPYGKILYFEACNKKINLRTGNEEYDFYGSIEGLMTEVPGYFLRSHRSYLVNSRKIKHIRLSEGLIALTGGVLVPLSRSYRQEFKRLVT